MIYSLTGRIALVSSDFCVIECSGVGFAVNTSATTVGQLQGTSGEATLYTSMSVREDDISLYGFATEDELSAFKLLTSVSGVGPKAAISILSVMTPQSFALAVATGDAKAFTKAKGVGPKVGQRIALELKDKVSKESDLLPESIGIAEPASSSAEEAILALTSLGYSRSEAARAASGAGDNASVEDVIKHALKNLSGV